MTDSRRDELHGTDPGHDAGASTAQTQAGEDLRDEPPPVDLRDTYGNSGPAIGDATATGVADVPEREGGPYPMPDVTERPHTAQTPATASGEPMRDPSLSRAVDREAAGLSPEAAGYDRTMEGPPPGPLDPEADEESPDAGGQPAGQWGSG